MTLRTKDELALILGQKIREKRIERNWTIGELALECNMVYTQVARIELGKINTSVYTIYQIAVALDIRMEELFAGVR